MTALHVAHDIPGRLRLRLPLGARTDGLTAAVAAEPGVISCTWSERTRSLLVLYEPGHGDRAAILDVVARVTGSSLPAGPARGTTTAGTRPEPGALLVAGVRQVVGEIDQRVQRASRGLFGLGTLLPLGLVSWSVAQVARGRATALSWTSALWYAHGLVRDYQEPAARD